MGLDIRLRVRKYFKVYRKTTTSLYGQSCELSETDGEGFELVYCAMPNKLALISRFAVVGGAASVILQYDDGSQVTRSGFFIANQMFPCAPYNFHPKD